MDNEIESKNMFWNIQNDDEVMSKVFPFLIKYIDNQALEAVDYYIQQSSLWMYIINKKIKIQLYVDNDPRIGDIKKEFDLDQELESFISDSTDDDLILLSKSLKRALEAIEKKVKQ